MSGFIYRYQHELALLLAVVFGALSTVTPDPGLRGLFIAGLIYCLLFFLRKGQLTVDYRLIKMFPRLDTRPKSPGGIFLESIAMGSVVALLFATGLTWTGQQGHYTDNLEERVMLGGLLWLGARILHERYAPE